MEAKRMSLTEEEKAAARSAKYFGTAWGWFGDL
jgi:hypothetical protein